MSRNTSITLGEHFDQFISEKIRQGRYHSASEAIRAGLRLLEERETKLEKLRILLTDGEQSPIVEGFSMDELIQELNAGKRDG